MLKQLLQRINDNPDVFIAGFVLAGLTLFVVLIALHIADRIKTKQVNPFADPIGRSVENKNINK